MSFFSSLAFLKACESSAFLDELPVAAAQFINTVCGKPAGYKFWKSYNKKEATLQQPLEKISSEFKLFFYYFNLFLITSADYLNIIYSGGEAITKPVLRPGITF